MTVKKKFSEYSILPQLGIVVNSEIEEEMRTIYPDRVNEKKIVENLRKELTDEEIETQLASTRNMTLNITDECNFRCSYCAFSGNYELGRLHNPMKMEPAIAKKAIDLYLNLVNSKRRKIKEKAVPIGCYGGEALLEFDLIKEIVDYARNGLAARGLSDIINLKFRVSTNGYLLDQKEILDFLVDNDITIDVSLDGPASEHDKFRFTRNGMETWEHIWSNLTHISEHFPEYFKQKIHFLATLHPLHDYAKIDNFFLGNEKFFRSDNVRANLVNSSFLIEKLKRKWFGGERNQYSTLLAIRSRNSLEETMTLNKISEITKFTGMCFPGRTKFFVSSDGKIYICERIKQDVPIGHVDSGFNYDTIRKIQKKWNEEIIQNRCWECFAWSFCGFCAAQCEDNNTIRIDCNKERYQQVITNFVEQLEDGKQTERSSFLLKENSLDEYLGQL